MKLKLIILLICCLLEYSSKAEFSREKNAQLNFDFYGDAILLQIDSNFIADFSDSLSQNSINAFYNSINNQSSNALISSLLEYKEKYKLDDWLYYQLIRKVAQCISPKTNNYTRYTLYKWFLLSKSGYNATLSICGGKILFYVQSDENVYEIPCHTKGDKQYVCLNYHDYGSLDFTKDIFIEVPVEVPGAVKSFSYKIQEMPSFHPSDYKEKEVSFDVYQNSYQFKIKLNKQIPAIFANYPVVDYASYFNIPMSKETYQSLIPVLQKNIKRLKVKDGVDYLMRFTRYAFLFETDTENFGKEKRLTAEQTLLYDHSDCEDRAALFFYLVKEIYHLPMIVLSYPKHVTIAVKFDKPVGTPIIYNGEQYSVCEPTPQKEDLLVGQLLPGLKKSAYEVVYAYKP